MKRTIDIIDLDDGPKIVTQDEAWRNLTRAVAARHGVDLNGNHPFHVRIVPAKSRGNHRMSAIIAYPKACTDPDDIFANAAISLFGEMTETLAGCALAQADLRALQG